VARRAGRRDGYSSLPNSEAPEAGNLIQGPVQYPGSRLTTAGEAWRQVRNQWIIPYGAALLAIAVLALAILYFTKGPLGQHGADTGRKIERFTPFERAAHWSNAIAFCVLAISGIVMAFGKFFLLPVMGLTLFGYLTYLLKNLHNFMGPLFVVSLVIIFFTFLRDNFPQKGDLRWLLSAGGMFSKHEPPSYRFNAGEKGIFWLGVFLLGTIVVAPAW
jgi:formate dehydrogenase subunit gamma